MEGGASGVFGSGSMSPAEPIGSSSAQLKEENLSFSEIRYGNYQEDDYRAALSRCRTMVFLCQNESQGIAYQQALACGVPIFAWDPGGVWKDPDYFPDKVQYEPVTSVMS